MAAYAYEHALDGGSNNPPDPQKPFDGLVEVTRSHGGPTNSPVNSIQFPAVAGVRYRIVIDGVAGATGEIALSWSFAASGTALPTIIGMPLDRSLREGDELILSFDVQSSESPEFLWFRDGQAVNNADRAVLRIPSLRRDQVGKYQLRIKLDEFVFYTAPVEIQINSEGQSDSLARDTIEHALISGLSGRGQPGGLRPLAASTAPIGVVRGYNGAQIFNTVTARRDPAEPNHCGVAGGASYWWAYHPPAPGRVTLNTLGSTFDTVLAVYTYDPPFIGYGSLVPVNCDDNSAGDGLSAVQFEASANRTYLVVVDGVDGARGLVQLNYRLENNGASNAPPIVQIAPAGRSVSAGKPVEFQVTASGGGPLSFQWMFNGVILEGQTNSALVLVNASVENAGRYAVRVSNAGGTVETSAAELRVLVAPALTAYRASKSLAVTLPSVPSLRYLLEAADPADIHRWVLLDSADGTGESITFNIPADKTVSLFHIRVE